MSEMTGRQALKSAPHLGLYSKINNQIIPAVEIEDNINRGEFTLNCTCCGLFLQGSQNCNVGWIIQLQSSHQLFSCFRLGKRRYGIAHSIVLLKACSFVKEIKTTIALSPHNLNQTLQEFRQKLKELML